MHHLSHPRLSHPRLRVIAICGLAGWICGGGCATTRDFRAPKERMLEGTAYTLQHREMRLGMGLVGIGTQDLGASLALAYGLGDRFQMGMNLAHAGLGVFNGSFKLNLVDRPRWGLGLKAEVRWVRGDWLWLLPDSTREELAGIDMLGIPLTIVGSLPLFEWMDLHLGFGYHHSEVWGDLNSDSVALDGAAGTRELFIEPTVRFYLWRKLALVVGAHLPLYARAAVTGTAEDQLEPDLIVGGTTAQWENVDFDVLDGYYGGAELRLSQSLYIQLYVTHGVVNKLLSTPVLPSLSLYWRF